MWQILLLIVLCTFSYFVCRRIKCFRLRQQLGLRGPPISFIFGNLHQLVAEVHLNNDERDHTTQCFKWNGRIIVPTDSMTLFTYFSIWGHFIKNGVWSDRLWESVYFHLVASLKKESDVQYKILSRWRETFGDIYGFYWGPRLVVYVANLDMIKEILIKKSEFFSDRLYFAVDEPEPNCYSLVMLKGQTWKDMRRALTPSFTSRKMKHMSTIVEQKVQILVGKLNERADRNKTFDIYKDFQAMTLDVIGQSAFAMRVSCQTDPKDPFLVDVQKLFKLVDIKNLPIVKCALVFPEIRWICSKLRLLTSLHRIETKLLNHLAKVVKVRKENFEKDENPDMLHLLLEQQASTQCCPISNALQLKDEVIIGNVYTFLLAGYETTSTALAFTAWLLAKNRDVQIKLQEEIDSEFDERIEFSNHDFLNGMPYLDAVFRESLRLFPPVITFVQRGCIQDCQILDQQFVANVDVHIPVYDIHHDPAIWLEPNKFSPERFIGTKNYETAAWLPFGLGPRNCIGMRFAEMEFKMAIILLLYNFDLLFGAESETDKLTVEEQSFVLRPKNGVFVTVKKRRKCIDME